MFFFTNFTGLIPFSSYETQLRYLLKNALLDGVASLISAATVLSESMWFAIRAVQQADASISKLQRFI